VSVEIGSENVEHFDTPSFQDAEGSSSGEKIRPL